MEYEEIRPDTIEGIMNFVDHGTPPGGFLTAVLCNDLKEACRTADSDNARALHKIVSFCYSQIPSACWGSNEKFNEWLRICAERKQSKKSD